MDSSERRITKRASVKLEINYIQEEDFLISHSKDISADGMFIKTEKPVPVDELLTLKFSLGKTGDYTVKARVIWTNTSNDIKNRGMGVKFIKTTEKFKNAILAYVKKVAVIEDKEAS